MNSPATRRRNYMFRRATILVITLPLLLCLVETARAQGTHQFLGKPRDVPDQVTSRHGIRFNTNGYDNPKVNWVKKIRKWNKKGVPDSVIQEIIDYPGSPEAIGEWIDDAFDKVQKQFTDCGGTLALRAKQVSPAGLRVTIMPSAFYEPYYKVYVAGAYFPTSREIKVLNIYYTWGGPYKGWLRHARDLLEWEIGNFYAVETGVTPEPRPEGWPCNTPKN